MIIDFSVSNFRSFKTTMANSAENLKLNHINSFMATLRKRRKTKTAASIYQLRLKMRLI
jgi:AAA15 family ATPase/GTPase